jgi:hypothetical protein
MSNIPGYTGPAYPLYSPIEAVTATCTAPYNHWAVGFKNCESAFHLANTILCGHDVIEEFVAAETWPISHGWAPTEIATFNMNWATQEVPFPRFGLQLKEGQSAEEFMDEIEKKVNAMIGESTMNEYKAYKNLVKHKRRINRVFSKVCGENSFRPRCPGIEKKAPAIAVSSCSAAPLKAPRGKSSNKRKGSTDEPSSSVVRLEKMKSLESSKRKSKSSEAVSDVELQATSSLAQLGQKKIKTAVKKVVVAEVRHVPSTFDDDVIVEPSRKGFFSYLWRDFRSRSTPGSENEFVDVESFSDDVTEVQMKVTTPVVAADVGDAVPQPFGPQDEASLEFTRELEMTVHRGENPVKNVPLVETREDLPEGQDPSPSIAAFNKSFGTSYRGELLSVGCEMAAAGGGASKLLTLWNSSAFMDEIREGAPK